MLGTHEDEEEELSARKISCRRRNMVKVRVQGSWIYASAHKTGSRQASRGYPSEPTSQACHVARLGAGSIELRMEGLESILPQQASGSCKINTRVSLYLCVPTYLPPSLTQSLARALSLAAYSL